MGVRGSPRKGGWTWGERCKESLGDVQNVSRLNNQTPSCPDKASSRERDVLCDGELLYWAVKVGDTCEDDCPLLRLSACSHMRACMIVGVGVYGLVRLEESRCVRFNDKRGRIGTSLRWMKEGAERIYLHNGCPKHNQTLAHIHIFPYPSLYRPSITN